MPLLGISKANFWEKKAEPEVTVGLNKNSRENINTCAKETETFLYLNTKNTGAGLGHKKH